MDGCRQIPFIDDGLVAVHTLVGVASLNLQGCMTLTDSGLAALGHMVSLTSCNLQDCVEITGEPSHRTKPCGQTPFYDMVLDATFLGSGAEVASKQSFEL